VEGVAFSDREFEGGVGGGGGGRFHGIDYNLRRGCWQSGVYAVGSAEFNHFN
jgi:hypothetical protein